MARRFVLLLGLAAAGCAPDRDEASEEPSTYDAVGTVVSIEGDHVLIDHEEIPGLMDAMTMTFSVTDPSVLEGLEQGTRVTFRVVVDGSAYVIDRIAPLEPPP